MVTITAKEWTGSAWAVSADISLGGNAWSGAHVIALPENATEAEIKAALLALYKA